MLATASAHAAARSTLVNFTNTSDSALTLTHKELDHGCWAAEPPSQIGLGQTVHFEAESCGFLTGDEFQAEYKLANGSTLELSYDNPFVGSNSYVENAPQGYLISRSGGGGDNAVVNQTFACNSSVCDGIPDAWKEKGVTIDPGGGNPSQFVDLPAMGVSLDRPTIMVQLDWMEDSTHDQALRQGAIDRVIKAFSEDPETYKGATRSGITLVVDAGPNSTITPGGAKWGSLSAATAIPWSADLLTGSRAAGYQFANFYSLLTSDFVPTGRLPIFHFAVAVAELDSGDSTSGVTPGNKLGFIVSLGDWEGGVGNENDQTGTFMHELGHTLGLQHGGEDTTNYKPNYPSIMNYLYQIEGVPLSNGTRVWDYSRDSEPALNEASLTEAGGVNLGSNPSGYGTGHACLNSKGNLEAFTQSTLAPVNWTCTGTPALGTGFDANGDGKIEVLQGASSDWSRINFKTGGVGAGTNASQTVTIPSSGVGAPSDELTTQMQAQIHSLPLNTKLTYTGATAGDYHNPVTVSATLLAPEAGDPAIAGRSISFQLGSAPSDSCSALTGASGEASCTITPSQTPGLYNIVASFAGDATYKAASATQPFTIRREATTLSYDGPANVSNGAPATLTGTLLADGTTPPSPDGQSVKFILGSGATSQSCTGTVASTGKVQCTIAHVNQPDGAMFTVPVSAEFAGDAFYLPSQSAPASVRLLYYTGRAYGISFSLRGHPPQLTADTGQVKTAQEITVSKSGLTGAIQGARSRGPNATVSTGGGAVNASADAYTFSMSGFSLPTIDATTLGAASRSTCAGATGSSTLSSLSIDGMTIKAASVPPNTVIDLLTGGTITLNEQIPAPGTDPGLTVNALHVDIPGVIDYVQSSATTGIHNCS